VKAADHASAPGERAPPRDRLADRTPYAEWKRAICTRSGAHFWEHGQYIPAARAYVSRCMLCGATQAIEKP
jgi:hypothetical protein